MYKHLKNLPLLYLFLIGIFLISACAERNAEREILRIRGLTQEIQTGEFSSNELALMVTDEFMAPLRAFIDETPRATRIQVRQEARRIIEMLIQQYEDAGNDLFARYFTRLLTKI